jgi:hypothetical protein
MVRSLLHLPECPQPADASDALAVALCHAQAARARDRIAKASVRWCVSATASGRPRASRVPTVRA